MSKQPIIVFEGIEGSGKTYHINNIEKLLIKTKKKYVKLLISSMKFSKLSEMNPTFPTFFLSFPRKSS